MLSDQTRDIKHFFFSQYLADGVRVTGEIVLPAVTFAAFGRLQEGLIISMGAFCVSISDAPGPLVHKRNGMMYCNICIFLMALLTGFANTNIISLGLLILFASFFFTMFSVFGERAGAIGTASLLIIILRMAYPVTVVQSLLNALLILGGGIWYMVIALALYRLRPYRPLQRALGDCIREMAKFLRIKAGLFSPATNLEDIYQQLVEQQVAVNTTQDAVRELLFKSRVTMKESTTMGRKLVITFVNVVDLYEQMMANWYDFERLREKYNNTGMLDDVGEIMTRMSNELDDISYDIQSNLFTHQRYSPLHDLELLKQKIDFNIQPGRSLLSLKKVLVNLRKLYVKMQEIYSYFDNKPVSGKGLRTEVEYSKFVAHQAIAPSVFISNLGLTSSVFRHALRMTIACVLGFMVSKLISYGHHSYWVLLTIAIILKPGFSLTKTRNFDRLIGTLTGGIIGILIIGFIQNSTALFAIMVLLMIGTYTFQRLRYIVMVICMTPFILILFNFLGLGILDLASERLLDTAIGSVIAFLASYFLFPYWEAKHLPGYMSEVISANLNYLIKLAQKICGQQPSSLSYKLTRKEVFVTTANLSAAFQRMQSEPKNKQLNISPIHEFVVLNHVLSSNIASVSAAVTSSTACSKLTLRPLKKAISTMQEVLLEMDKEKQVNTIKFDTSTQVEEPASQSIITQLQFLEKVTTDLSRVIKLITH